jgi:hypothetical protein
MTSTTSNNTAVGRSAGYISGASPTNANAVTTGDKVTFVGANAGLGSATQRTNSTAIGYAAYVDVDNTVVFGDQNVTDILMGSTSQATVNARRLLSTPTSAACTSASSNIPLTYRNIGLVTDGSSTECSGALAAGTIGQEINVYCAAVGNAADSIRIVPSTLVGWASVKLAANPLGKSATFLYTPQGWVVLASTGTLA